MLNKLRNIINNVNINKTGISRILIKRSKNLFENQKNLSPDINILSFIILYVDNFNPYAYQKNGCRFLHEKLS